MPLKSHERHAIAFLLRHLAVGVAGGVVFGVLLLVFDIGHLRKLVSETSDGPLYVLLLFFGLFVTFGGVAMAVGIMAQGQDEN